MKKKNLNKQKKWNKQNYLAMASSVVALSAIAGSLSPLEALASNPSQTLNFANSLNQTQSKTLTIPNLVRVQNISTDNGNVNYSINGENLTITVTGGKATGQQFNATKYSKSASNTQSNSTNVFPSTNSYSDGTGYSGTLSKSGASTVLSGVYTPSDTKSFSDSITSTSNSFASTKSYSSGGYSGTLSKSGSVTSSNVATGGYYQDTGYYEDTGYWDSDGYYEETGYWSTRQVCTGENISNGNGKVCTTERTWVSTGSKWVSTGRYWVSTGQRWVSTGQQYVTTYTTYYTQNYSGTATKPSSDTRVYQQAYSGTAYKSGNDDLYGYTVNVEYVTDITPPADATVKSSNTSPTNKDVTLTISYASDAVIKEYKVGNGTWTNYTAPVIVSSNETVYTRSTDDAGNVSTPTQFKVMNIDKVAPLTPSFDIVPSKNAVAFTNLVDADSGVKEVLYTVDGGAWNTYNGSFELPDGEYAFQVKTLDKAGNVSQVATNISTLYKERLASGIDAVEKAEDTRTQEDVDKAKDLVDKMPPSSDKDDLLDRLEEVQHQIDAEKAVDKAEETDKRPDYDSAVELVDKVTNPTVKEELEDRLEKQKEYLDFLDKVEELVKDAEKEKTQESVDKARTEVEKLEADDQPPFKDRLDAIQDYIDAVEAVEKAKDTRDEEDVKDAKDKIDLLDKTKPELVDVIIELEKEFEVADILALIAKERFDILLPKYNMSKEAYNSLVQSYFAIKYTGDFMYVRAGEKFKLVPGTDKYFGLAQEQYTNLNKDYDEFVEERIQTQAEIKATSLVKTLEGNYNPYFEKQAQESIDAVEDPKIKADLQKRFNDAKAKYEASKVEGALQKATTSVEKAESTKQAFYIREAYKLVDALTDETLKITLTDRLVALEAQIELDKVVASVTQAVENAERYKSATFITTAQNKVTDLPDGEVKNALQLRLDNLKAGNVVTDQSLLVKKAENALSLAQSLKKQTYVDKAQTAIDLIEDEIVKAELQAKLDAIIIK